MTGDGVNDAPALKKADCGIAVSGATDAARAAASIVLMTPGLSVIIDAIKESRKIFQRMNSYAIYRIAETLRVLLFMTLSILIFNFYPLTAIMIVMLALLNDGAILSIAYDNVHYKDQPEAWNMRLVLGIATVLGVVGPMAAFGLFYLGDRVFHLDHPHLQTLMYLMLSVAGHLTIFQTRTRGPFWSIRPARILLLAVLGTQMLATLIAVYGLFMTPLGWTWAAFVWGYALAWFLVTDQVKLAAYRIFDPAAAPLLVRNPADWKQLVATRAYELYEEGGHRADHADQDWLQAEQEVRKGLRRNMSRRDTHEWCRWKDENEDQLKGLSGAGRRRGQPEEMADECGSRLYYTSKDHYQELLAEHVTRLSSLQQLLYATNRHAVLLIFQAMDAAGKDGAIRHVMSGVNPQGVPGLQLQASQRRRVAA